MRTPAGRTPRGGCNRANATESPSGRKWPAETAVGERPDQPRSGAPGPRDRSPRSSSFTKPSSFLLRLRMHTSGSAGCARRPSSATPSAAPAVPFEAAPRSAWALGPRPHLRSRFQQSRTPESSGETRGKRVFEAIGRLVLCSPATTDVRGLGESPRSAERILIELSKAKMRSCDVLV